MKPEAVGFAQTIQSIQPKPTVAPQVNALQSQSFEQIFHQIQQNTTVSFSKHAQSRLNERSMQVDVQRLNQAVDKASAKGIKDTLVLMDQAAFIVNVSSRVVITAMNQEEMKNNVFTNIDGAVIS